MKRTLSFFFTALAGGLLAVAIGNYLKPTPTSTSLASPPLPTRYVSLPGSPTPIVAVDFTDAAERSVNAVVHVTTETTVNVRDPFAEFFWGYRAPAQQQRQGAGSGVIVEPRWLYRHQQPRHRRS
jgi:serine protease Do